MGENLFGTAAGTEQIPTALTGQEPSRPRVRTRCGGISLACRATGGVAGADTQLPAFIGAGGTTEGTTVGTESFGHTTSTGTEMTIDNTAGSERINLIHHSGAHVVIEADGSIHLISTSRRGFGIGAPSGDGVIYVHGKLMLKGDSSIFVETTGNMEMNVKGDYYVNVDGNMITRVKGSQQNLIDQTLVQEVAKDKSEIIGGQDRKTVAGDSRTQVTGNLRYDVGATFDQRVQGKLSISTKENAIFCSSNDFDIMSHSAMTIASADAMMLQTENSLYNYAADNLTSESGSGTFVRSAGKVVASAGTTMNLDATTSIKSRSDAISLDGTSSVNIATEESKINASGTLELIGGSKVDINPGGPGLTPQNPSIPRIRQAFELDDCPGPELLPEESIVDSMTTERQAPEIAENGNNTSDADASIRENDGDRPPAAYRQAAARNQGAVPAPNPGYIYTVAENAGVGESQNNINPTTPNFNIGQMVSEFVSASTLKLPPRSQRTELIWRRAINVCTNIMDPLFRKYPIHITSGYRADSTRHSTGGAVDFRVTDREDSGTVGEIALWIRDNLPYSTLLLEANNQGSVHIHVESKLPSGLSRGHSKGDLLWTCQNSSCTVYTEGIYPNLATYWRNLRRAGIL